MAIKMYKVTPDYITEPGDTIRETLEAVSMTQAELAEKMGITRKHVSELLMSKSRITSQTANQLEFVLNVPAKFWLSLQSQYDDFAEKQKQDELLAKHVQYADKFPYTNMAKLGFVPKTTDKVERLKNLLRFFRVSSFDAFKNQTDQNPLLVGALRSSVAKFEVDNFALQSWLQAGTLMAIQIQTEDFDAEQLAKKIPEFRQLVQLDDSEVFMPKLQKLAASVGIAVVAVPELPKSRVSGSTRWLSPFPKAIIELSFRQKTHDSFWFTFFHELGHLVLHNKTPFFTINKKYDDSVEEKQADQWAANSLIPKHDWQGLVSEKDFSKQAIIAFAQRIQTHPDIVLGRLQNDHYVDYRQFSELRVHYSWQPKKLAE